MRVASSPRLLPPPSPPSPLPGACVVPFTTRRCRALGGGSPGCNVNLADFGFWLQVPRRQCQHPRDQKKQHSCQTLHDFLFSQPARRGIGLCYNQVRFMMISISEPNCSSAVIYTF